MNRDWLYDKYIVNDKRCKDIASDIGCKTNTIQCWVLKFGFKKDIIKRQREHKEKYQDRDFLYIQHIVNHKSISDIAKELNVSVDTISRWLKIHEIPMWYTNEKISLVKDAHTIRDLYLIDRMSSVDIAMRYGTTHKNVLNTLRNSGVDIRTLSESQFNHNDKEVPPDLSNYSWLYEQHWELHISCKDIAIHLGVDAGVVRNSMHRLGIKTRNNSKSKVGLMTGENHPNWQGGKTELKQLLREFFEVNLKPVAAKRDKYTCQLCGKTHTVLHVHHIKTFSEMKYIVNTYI